MADEDLNAQQQAPNINPQGENAEAPMAGANPQATEQPMEWPSEWRAKLSSGDEKELKRLQSFNKPEDIYKSYRQLEQKLSKGEIRINTPFPEKGTDSEKEAWRKSHGIPESFDKYDLNLGNGLVIGENDKAVVESFLKKAHEGNMNSAAVKAALSWYAESQVKAKEEMEKSDKAVMKTNMENLKKQWGADFDENMNIVHSVLSSESEEIKEAFFNGRMADGTPIGSNPTMLNFLAKVGREMNPTSTLTGGIPPDNQSIIDEISTIENLMRNKNSEYWKGAKANTYQERYRNLITARDKLAQRSK